MNDRDSLQQDIVHKVYQIIVVKISWSICWDVDPWTLLSIDLVRRDYVEDQYFSDKVARPTISSAVIYLKCQSFTGHSVLLPLY